MTSARLDCSKLQATNLLQEMQNPPVHWCTVMKACLLASLELAQLAWEGFSGTRLYQSVTFVMILALCHDERGKNSNLRGWPRSASLAACQVK